MKKLFFDKIASVVMVVLMTAMCVTLTACGGSDDDPLDNPNPSSQGGGGSSTDGGNNGGTSTGELKFYMPLIDWTATKQKVAEYMSKNLPDFNPIEVEGTSLIIGYMNRSTTSLMYYTFDENRLILVATHYLKNQGYTTAFLLEKVKEVCGKMPTKVEKNYYEATGNGIHGTVSIYDGGGAIVTFADESDY